LRNSFIYVLEFICICLSLGVHAAAQTSNPPAGDTGSANRRMGELDPWARVESLAPNSRLRIVATKNGGDCILQSASADGLVCLHGRNTRSVRRTDVKSIKFARRGRSAAGGLAIGAAVGAGAGAGIGSAINSSDTGSLAHVSGGKSAGVGAAIGVIAGGAIGGLIGYRNDLFPGPLIYKR
jgi:hypothetical protein